MRFPRWPGSMSRRVRNEIALAKRLVSAHMTTDVYEGDRRSFAELGANGAAANAHHADACCNRHGTNGFNGVAPLNGAANGTSPNGGGAECGVDAECLPAIEAAHSARSVTLDPSMSLAPDGAYQAVLNGSQVRVVRSAPRSAQGGSQTYEEHRPTRAQSRVCRDGRDGQDGAVESSGDPNQTGWFDSVSCYLLLALIVAIGALFLAGVVVPLL